MKKNLFYPSTIIFCLLLLCGCSLPERSTFTVPSADIPESWPQENHTVTQAAALDKWWEQFNNPELNSLITRALQTNNDLALATLTLRKARLQAGLSENDKLPELSFSSSASAEKSFDSGDTDNSYSTSSSLSYELDLWGRLSAASDATQWTAEASAEDRESTAQSLVVTVATLYWRIGYLNQRLYLAEHNIKGIEQVVSLTKSRYDNGSTTLLAVLESTQSLYKQQVNYSQLQQQLTESRNALSILLNQPLQDAMMNIEKLPEGTLPEIAAGVPADLLLRRPDVKSSLYQLKSALANKDAVAVSYLPTLTLTGELSTSSSQLVELLHNPVATLGAGLALPFLEWNKMQLNKKISDVDHQTAVINYRTTLYQAFAEVANYLSARQHYLWQGKKLQKQYTNARQIEKIYASRYSVGAINMVDWINAVEDRRDVQASLLENQYNQFVTQAKLYQSLGGGDIAPEIESNK